MSTFGLACALVGGLLNSTIPYVFKRQSGSIGQQAALHVVGMLLAALVAGVFLAARGLPLGGRDYLLLSMGSGALVTINGFVYFSVVVQRGPMSISWAVVWMAAVTVAVLGWGFLGEPILAGQPFGLACFVACLVVMAVAAHKARASAGSVNEVKPGFWLWLAVCLVAVTFGNLLMKLKDLSPPVGHSFSFVFVRCVTGAAMLAAFCRVRGMRMRLDRLTVKLGAAYGALFLANLLLILEGIKVMKISAFFPAMAGSAILFGMVWAVASGERPSKLAYVGAALSVAAIVLVNVGGAL